MFDFHSIEKHIYPSEIIVLASSLQYADVSVLIREIPLGENHTVCTLVCRTNSARNARQRFDAAYEFHQHWFAVVVFRPRGTR